MDVVKGDWNQKEPNRSVHPRAWRLIVCNNSSEPVDLKGAHFSDSSRCQALQSLADEDRGEEERRDSIQLDLSIRQNRRDEILGRLTRLHWDME